MNKGKRVSWQIAAVSAAAFVAGAAQAHDRGDLEWRDYGHHERYDRYYAPRHEHWARREAWRDYRWRHHHDARYYGPRYGYGYGYSHRVWAPVPTVILPPLPPWHR